MPKKSDFTLEIPYMHHTIGTDITIVAISIAGCSTKIAEATKPPNFALLPILSHFICLA